MGDLLYKTAEPEQYMVTIHENLITIDDGKESKTLSKELSEKFCYFYNSLPQDHDDENHFNSSLTFICRLILLGKGI